MPDMPESSSSPSEPEPHRPASESNAEGVPGEERPISHPGESTSPPGSGDAFSLSTGADDTSADNEDAEDIPDASHLPEAEHAEDALWRDGAVWLDEDDILTDGETPQLGSQSSPPASPRIGPALPEAIGWMGGAFALQLFGGFVGGAIALVLYLAHPGTVTPDKLGDPDVARQVMDTYQDLILAVVQTVMVSGALVAVSLRLGRERRRLLSFRPVYWRHLFLVLAAILPIGLLSMQLYVLGQDVWQSITEHLPGFRVLDELDSTLSLEQLMHETPVLLLLLMFAVAPAIWEELVFRGVIGRGLLARYGIVGGVALTSVLFAAMHLSPPHVVALLPLSVFLHLAYLATRSFWAPVLIHLLNNGLAILMLKASPEVASADAAAAQMHANWPIILAASVCCVVLMVVLYQSRVEFVQPDGRLWSPGFPTAESPPPHIPAETACRSVSALLWIIAGLSLFGLLLTVGLTTG